MLGIYFLAKIDSMLEITRQGEFLEIYQNMAYGQIELFSAIKKQRDFFW